MGGAVLLVDDNNSTCITFKEEMRQRGVEVVFAHTGEELINNPIDFSKISTAIVSHYFRQSKLDGFDIVEFLRNEKVEKIHLCSPDFNDPEVVRKAKEHGVCSIMERVV